MPDRPDRPLPETPTVAALLGDLDAERKAVLAIVEQENAHVFATPTPSPGWTVRDQLAHLAFFDEMATLAVTDSTAFRRERDVANEDTAAYEREHLARVPTGKECLLAAWAAAAEKLALAVSAADPAHRVPWYGPDMALRSFITARIMETWAHGQDTVDALGAQREPTDRLRHIATLAVRARPYSYRVRGLTPPEESVRVELTGPAGDRWVLGAADAAEVVRGPAEDFCLVLTRRRHVDDTALRAIGAAAREWLEIGQVYAGPPGDGPKRRANGRVRLTEPEV